MNQLFGRASDLMLGLLAPKLKAEAAIFIGCCDWCVCYFQSEINPNNKWCAQCSCSRC
ncbi:hypothetical protein [Planobispora longispora]|uniref:Uncharacterized protein n=1 Tax=Planobispora longispora TaxID=28887 RepID=A0A8J3RN31_9ACTN|nr:hypothetical protein [Planobispora longispora]BFE79715.1 hypothetical protein GCM10020093_023160 [Planobispora longispora]GIH78030.1 hypothetical protein Plo01_44590 [Planobispora longispora]